MPTPYEEPLYCPHCKKPVSADARFCPSCGQSQTAMTFPFPVSPPVSPTPDATDRPLSSNLLLPEPPPVPHLPHFAHTTGSSAAAVEAGAFLNGALPFLLLCTLVSPVVYAMTYGIGFVLLLPLACVVPTMLGIKETKAVRSKWSPGEKLPSRARMGYFVGALYVSAALFLQGLALAPQSSLNPPDGFWLVMMAFPLIPAQLLCVSLSLGARVNDSLESVAGCQSPRSAMYSESAVALGRAVTPRGFAVGGWTLLPASIVTFLEFGAGSVDRILRGAEPLHPNGFPLSSLVVEIAYLVAFLAVLWLHQTLLILVIARIRALRGGAKTVLPAYLRLLCVLGSLVAGVLLSTLFCLSRTAA